MIAAAADLARLPAQERHRMRYLDLGPIPPAERPSLIAVLAGHCNGLSRQADLAAPVARGTVLRLDLADYGWDAQTWEQLASPYHHVQVREARDRWERKWHPAGRPWTDGRTYAQGFWYQERVQARTSARSALAPWLSESKEAASATLYLATQTQSQVPIVSGQWFLWQTAVQEGRKPGYYDFLGVRDEKGFQQLVRFDARLAAQLEQRRVVIFSGVTQEPRRVERAPTVLGGLWRTFDSAEATEDRNPLKLLNGGLKYDATEQFAPLPNGMPAFFLANGAGVRQDKAPDSIVAGDRHSTKDPRLHVNLSCIRCHLMPKGAQGILDIDGVPIRAIKALDAQKLRELRRQYLRDITPLMEQDRRSYSAAIKTATGMEPAEYATAYSRWYQRLDEARVDAAWAGRDFGLPAEQALARLRAVRGELDPVLSVIAAGGAIPIRQWHEAIPKFWEATR